MLSSVSTEVDDRFQASIPPMYVTKSTQPCIPLGSLNEVHVLALIGWGVVSVTPLW